MGASFVTGGKFHNAVRLNGGDSILYLKGDAELDGSISSKRTISVWFNADSVTQDKQIIYEEGGLERGLNIYLDAGKLYVGGWNLDQSGWGGTFLSTAVSSGQWHHVALVLDAGEAVQVGGLTGYLDGKSFGTGEASQLWQRDQGIGVGRTFLSTRAHDGSRIFSRGGFKGKIDDVRIFNHALDTQAIADLNAGVNASDVPAYLADFVGDAVLEADHLEDAVISDLPWRARLLDEAVSSDAVPVASAAGTRLAWLMETSELSVVAE